MQAKVEERRMYFGGRESMLSKALRAFPAVRLLLPAAAPLWSS